MLSKNIIYTTRHFSEWFYSLLDIESVLFKKEINFAELPWVQDRSTFKYELKISHRSLKTSFMWIYKCQKRFSRRQKVKRAQVRWNSECKAMQEYVCKRGVSECVCVCVVSVRVCLCLCVRVGWKYNKESFLLSALLESIFFPLSVSEAFSIQTTQREVRNTFLELLCPDVLYKKKWWGSIKEILYTLLARYNRKIFRQAPYIS
jgi:hypothetical protein